MLILHSSNVSCSIALEKFQTREKQLAQQTVESDKRVVFEGHIRT
jgi:hypothetical protein